MSKDFSWIGTMLLAWGSPKPLRLDTQIDLAYGRGGKWKEDNKREEKSTKVQVSCTGWTQFVLRTNDPLQFFGLIIVKTHYLLVVPSSMDLIS